MTNKELIEKIKKHHEERLRQNEFYTASFIHVDWLLEKIEELEKQVKRYEEAFKEGRVE